jgi:uncharacterized protein (DUF2237 family)
MITALYTTSYLEGQDWQGNDRLQRNLKYLKYYQALKEKLGYDKIVFADNASSDKNRHTLLEAGGPDVSMIGFEDHLPRTSIYGYPYCWRALYAFEILINKGYEKIINIDSDCFVLTQRALDYIKNLETGWTTFWCKKYGFPETAIQIICKDTFPEFLDFTKECRWEDRGTSKPMEILLPFTHVNKELNCDRWGETREALSPDKDIYCQGNLDTNFVFQSA